MSENDRNQGEELQVGKKLKFDVKMATPHATTRSFGISGSGQRYASSNAAVALMLYSHCCCIGLSVGRSVCTKLLPRRTDSPDRAHTGAKALRVHALLASY